MTDDRLSHDKNHGDSIESEQSKINPTNTETEYNQPNLFVFEGDNGVGKTTIIKCVSEIIPVTLISTPTDEYKKLREYIHRRNSTYGKFLYYLSSVFDASHEIEKMGNRIYICDRYIASSFVDFLILSGLCFEQIESFYSLFRSELIKPITTFLLKCEHHERVRRILSRGSKSQSDNITLEYSLQTNEYYKLLMKNDSNWVEIDTTYQTIETIVQDVVNLIQTKIS